jgi:release factor glutamine methyltransferase
VFLAAPVLVSVGGGGYFAAMNVGNAPDAWTIVRLLTWTKDHFAARGLESPRLCAEILLAHALGCDRIQLYARHDQVPSEEALASFRALVKPAAAGTPIAYLTGRKEFFSLPFAVTPDVLVPRPETEVLVERTIDLVRSANGACRSLLDLGTGSGCIVVSLAKHLPDVKFFASDISEAALVIAQQNAQKHAVGERIEFRCGDLFAPWAADGTLPQPLPETEGGSQTSGRGDASEDAAGSRRRFDLIVANAPYIGESEAHTLPASVREHEPRVALFGGPQGLEIIRRLVAESPDWLAPAGYLFLEVAFNQAAQVRGLFSATVWSEVVTHRDGLGHERAVQARLRPAPSAD